MLIIVKIRRLQGKDEDIEIDSECTIVELKQFLHQRLGIDPTQQRLIFCGHVLDDTKTISDCNIGHNQVVHMVTSLPPLPARSVPEPDLSETENASGPAPVGQSSFVFVSHEDQVSTSPTAIRLRILQTIVSELRTRILELDSGADVEGSPQTVEDNPVAEFARLIEEIHRLDRLFETHRENYIGIINEIRDTNGPRDERSIQARMRYSEQINGVFHNFAHAFHLLSDIAMLESPHGTQLASEAFLRQDETATVQMHSGRTGNMDGNINEPFNVEIDPIMIQLQIETSETTMGQRNASNPPPEVDMEDLNPDDLMPQDGAYGNPQEYLRSLQQRMLSVMQPGLRSTAAALDFGMELDDTPMGTGNLQDYIGNSSNLAGIAQNLQSPMMGSVPSELIQQILSSVLRHEVQGGNWNNTDQNATAPGPRPENVQLQRRPAEDSPGHEARRDSISNVVYDQATPCESRHIQRALHMRSGMSSSDPLQHNDSASTRVFFALQSLYDRLDRNPRSPDNLVIACFLLLREAVVPSYSRYLSTIEVLQVGDVVVTFFRGLLQNVSHEQSVERVTDIIMSRHTPFLRRVPLMVNVCQAINMTASIRAVLTHHLPAIFNLISIREPNEFSRNMRALVPEFYHDMAIVLFQCVEESCMALETVFRAYLIDCVCTMDETNRDLLLNIAFYCMSAGVYRASMSLDEPPHFIVPHNTLETDSFWDDSPQPSTSRATESSVNLARDMYSGNLPRARPTSTSRVQSMRIRSIIPVDANRSIRNTGSVMPRPQPGTGSAQPPDTEAIASTSASAPSGPAPLASAAAAPAPLASAASGSAPVASAAANAQDSASPAAVPSASTSANSVALPMALVQFVSRNVPGSTPSYTMVNESNIDWWSLEEDQLIAIDEERESGRESPFSDAYHVGNSQRSQEQSLPTDLDAFAEHIYNELGENVEVNDHIRSMFLSFICRSISERSQQSPDYDRIRFLASTLLTDNNITPDERRRYQKELRTRWNLMRSPDRNK